MHTLPELVRRYPERVQEAIQPAGSMMYIPEGVWHAVWNVADTVAVTHNSIARSTFEKLYGQIGGRLDAKLRATTSATQSGACGSSRELQTLTREEREERIARRIDKYFGFGAPNSTLAWCQMLRMEDGRSARS